MLADTIFLLTVSISSLHLTTKLKCPGQYTTDLSEGSASSNSCLLKFDLSVVAGVHSTWTLAVFMWSLEAPTETMHGNYSQEISVRNQNFCYLQVLNH